jgi:hypothetical protein
MHQVIIRISPDGKTSVKAEGYQGPSCTTVTAPFLQGLGQVIDDTPTPEMYLPPLAQNQETTL